MSIFEGSNILITGGTGSFGNAFIAHALEHLNVARIRVFSRDELKQAEMKERFSDSRLRYFVGDIRDADRLKQALDGVDIVIHAAAMKRVEACEYNPFEAIKTNIIGTQNIVTASIEAGVKRVMLISSDKAVNPSNLYGATKLCAEKIALQANQYVGAKDTVISAVRYGNVVGSRGSIVPIFLKQRELGEITITDERMSRFFITLPQAVLFVTSSIEKMLGGEVFIPKLPSMKVTDIAKAIAPNTPVKIIGIQPGEKLAEVMITEDESRYGVDIGDRYVIEPSFLRRSRLSHQGIEIGEFRYASDTNTDWLSPEDLKDLV